MNRRVGKAPDGQWEMADPTIILWLGRFIIAWATIESTMEVVIAKELGVDPVAGSIITSGLQFKSRAAVLSSLLSRDQVKNKEGLAILKEIRTIGDRNDILHSVIGGSKSVIWFNRRKNDPKFTSKIEKYDAERLESVTTHCANLAADMQICFGISTNDYVSFFQDAHNAVNSAPVSPKPPL